MRTDFKSRRIGEVNIFEVRGVFLGPPVQRIRQEMEEALESDPCEGLLFNVREMEKLDDSGAKAALDALRRPPKGGILGQNLSAYFIAEHMIPQESIPIFEKGCEAVEFFGKEFAHGKEDLAKEKRKFPRISTALPFELDIEIEGESFLFEGLTANLGEGGLFANFLDSRTEELAERVIDPYDLKMFDVRLGTKADFLLEVHGKVLRMKKGFSELHGLAVEFYDLTEKDENRIREFLKTQRIESKR